MYYNPLKSLDNKIFFFSIFGLFFLISCTSAHSEPQNLKKASTYQTQINDLKSLMLPQSDFEDSNALSGFIWTPFVLPLQNLTITNAALFVGANQKHEDTAESNGATNTFMTPPEEGHCEILLNVSSKLNEGYSKEDESKISAQKKLFVFKKKSQQKRVNTSLFFILDTQTRKPVAVARLNAKGESECLLPPQPYLISIGFGRQRHETQIDGKSKNVILKFPLLSAIRVNPSVTNNIQNGDIIRIGRKINLDFTKQKIVEFSDLKIASKIHSDLYVNADMMSHDLAVDEYMKTSFLVGQNKYQIELEPGDYVVALLRKNKLVCLNAFKLKENSEYDLSCHALQIKKTKEDIAYQFESDDTIFDVGFRPKSLIRNKNFVSWTVDTPGTLLLGEPMQDTNSKNNTNSLDETDFFSLVFKEKTNATISETSYGASLSESISKFQIPLIGMSKEQLLEGQVPFSEYVRATSQKYFLPYFLNLTNVIHTNGAEISILEPMLTNTGVLFATNSQDFLIRVKVPKWNATQILEMYINDTLSKRWILNRGALSQAFGTTEKVNTYETENFKVKFVTRGESPLPNFLTGRNAFLPFAETREFCVSLDGKDKCS